MTSKEEYVHPPPPYTATSAQQPQQPGYPTRTYSVPVNIQRSSNVYPVQATTGVIYNPGTHSNIMITPVPVATTNDVRPDEHFVIAMLSCLFCFCPTGTIAVVFSCNVRNANDRMDYEQAKRDGYRAKMFSIISLIMGFVWICGTIIAMFVPVRYWRS